MIEKKFFSIITVVLNSKDDLTETIKSLRAKNLPTIPVLLEDELKSKIHALEIKIK